MAEKETIKKEKINKAKELNKKGKIGKPKELNQKEKINKPNGLNKEGKKVKPNKLNKEGKIDNPNELNKEGKIDNPNGLNKKRKKDKAKELNQKEKLNKANGLNKEGKKVKPNKINKKEKKICPMASKCGGCQWINKSYEEQLRAKSLSFHRLMEPFCRPEAIIGMENPEHYRNKVHAAFGEDHRHNAISGIYEEKSHRIVPVDSCLIENRKADEIIVSIRGLLKSFKIRPYNEDTGFGLLRHVLVRVGYYTGEIMVVLVLSSPVMPSKNNFVKALLKLHPEITTIVLNVNDRDTSMILGEREQAIYGKGYIEDRLCGMVFRISPKSFYQVNPAQTEKLYAKAMEYAGLTGKETVLDAYCGTGTIGMIASRDAARVLGVELNKDAVRDAVSNARQNQITNIRFYLNDAGKFLLEMAGEGAPLDVLLMDPPRSGSSEEFLDAAAKIAPRRIVYISCNPVTLARDLKLITKKGYRVQKCVAVDMFPFTDAVEAVVLLTRNSTQESKEKNQKRGKRQENGEMVCGGKKS